MKMNILSNVFVYDYIDYITISPEVIQCQWLVTTRVVGYIIDHKAGADSGGGAHPARAPPKIGKNMIFLE
jgi:hypothetical protein